MEAPDEEAGLGLPEGERLLEVALISAQGLKQPHSGLPRRRLHAYAVAWVDAGHKLQTRADDAGGLDPAWHARLLFRVREASLADDSRAAVSVEIYAVAAGTWHFGGDSLVGSVRFLLGDHRLLSRPIGRLRNVPVTARAASLASLRSWNSASTLCVPRTFSSTRHASSRCPRNTRLLGIFGGKSAPTKMAMAGLMASSGF